MGYSQRAPYDRIIVTADARDVSPYWVEQLAEGGVLVASLWFKGFSLSVALEKQTMGLKGSLRHPAPSFLCDGPRNGPRGTSRSRGTRTSHLSFRSD